MDVVTEGINSPQRNTEEEEPKDETERLAREVGGKPRGKAISKPGRGGKMWSKKEILNGIAIAAHQEVSAAVPAGARSKEVCCYTGETVSVEFWGQDP